MAEVKDVTKLSEQELYKLKASLEESYNDYVSHKLSLDMSRGKPSGTQLNTSNGLLNSLTSYITEDGIDARNYGVLDGLKETKRIFSELLNIKAENIIIGGNSSLNLFYDTITRLFIFGTRGCTPWGKLPKVKVICPTPGYDRHFLVLNEFGIEMVPVPLNDNGPDMDIVEDIVKNDASVKGIISIPLYSNPSGICYSDETIERMAALKTAADDFCIFWDNAYGVHHIYEEIKIKDIFEASEKHNTEDRIYYYFSTSKITFPGAGVSLVAGSEKTTNEIRKHMSIQTIGSDKLSQLRFVEYFKNADNVRTHMKKLAKSLRPKFEAVLDKLSEEFTGTGLLKWIEPKGGYFISVDTIDGCAKETVRLAKEAGVVLTNAGATYPHGNDPHDSNIRIAPSYPEMEELTKAIDVFCVCVKLAAVNKLLMNK